MGTFEIINFGLSAIMGAGMTIWQQARKDRHQEHQWSMARQQSSEDSTQSAREHEAKWQGYYWVRSLIAVMASCYLFALPAVIVLFLSDVQMAIGYYDTVSSVWPWSDATAESVHWVKAGAAEPSRVLVQPPALNNICTTIIGLYFGKQFSRRG